MTVKHAQPVPLSRQEILDKSIEVFAKKGFNCTNAADLMDSTGGTHSRVFKEFNTISELVIEAFKSLSEKYELVGGEKINRQPDGLSALKIAEQLLLVTAFEIPPLPSMVLNLYSASFTNPVIREFCNNVVKNRSDLYRTLIMKGMQDGSIKADIDVEDTLLQMEQTSALFVWNITSCGPGSDDTSRTVRAYQVLFDNIAGYPQKTEFTIPEWPPVSQPVEKPKPEEKPKVEQPIATFPQTRQEILQKAIEVYARNGLNCTSAGDLMDATGGTKSRLFKEYGSTNEILVEAFEYVVSIYQAEYFLETMPDGISALKAFMQSILDRYKDFPVRAPMVLSIFASAFKNPEIRKYASDLYHRRDSIYRQILDKGIEDGTIRKDIDIDDIVNRCIATGFQYTINSAVVSTDADAIRTDAVFREIID